MLLKAAVVNVIQTKSIVDLITRCNEAGIQKKNHCKARASLIGECSFSRY